MEVEVVGVVVDDLDGSSRTETIVVEDADKTTRGHRAAAVAEVRAAAVAEVGAAAVAEVGAAAIAEV